MNNFKEILNFNFSEDNFIYYSKNIISKYTYNALEININKLKEIGYGDEVVDLEISTKRNAVLKFKRFAIENNIEQIVLSKKELRTLCYSLSYSEYTIESILSNEYELIVFLDLIDEVWKESFLKGLMYTYFVHFDKSNNSIIKLESYLVNKIEFYVGGNAFYNFFKKNKKYLFLNNGDITLGYELALKNIKILDITFAINRPKSWISYSYFSGVLCGYYERNKNNISSYIDDLFTILKEHNNIITYKKIISKLIIQANESQYSDIQRIVKLKALEIIKGDPSIHNSFWFPFDNATANEKNDLKNAQIILNEWLTKEFISVFFKECINEPRRKKFWIKYASSITDFKVFGPEHIKKRLQQNQIISKIVNSRFRITNSNQSKCAFVFQMGDYNLIEFSEEGYAFVARKSSQFDYINRLKTIQSIEELRSSNNDEQLVKSNGHSFYAVQEDGRLFHKDSIVSWEQKFDYWINKKIR
jgi:hypothetical protein